MKMGLPITIRLDKAVRDELQAQARHRGLSLSALLRDLATCAARDARRARIRGESKRVAEYVASSEGARSFYEDWGAPNLEVAAAS